MDVQLSPALSQLVMTGDVTKHLTNPTAHAIVNGSGADSQVNQQPDVESVTVAAGANYAN